MIISQSKENISRKALRDCARLYCEIWREPPWNEDFWQESEVLVEILDQIGKANAEIVLAIIDDQVVGFTWGYEISLNESRQIASSRDLEYLFSDKKRIFYIDELAVAKEQRQNGLGLQLSTQIMDFASSNRFDFVILRTDEKAIPARKLYQRLGFKELAVRDGKHISRTYWSLIL